MKRLVIAVGVTLSSLPLQGLGAVCTRVPPGLVSWWPGDGDAYDIQDGNFGLPQNGAAFAAGAVGLAFSFDGITNGANFGNPAALQLQTFTIDAWVKRGDATQITRDAPNPSFPDGLLFSQGSRTLRIEQRGAGAQDMPRVRSGCWFFPRLGKRVRVRAKTFS